MGLVAFMGGNEFREDCIPLDRDLLGMARESLRVVVVPTAAAFQNPSKAAENGVRYFNSLGADATAAMILSRSDADDPANLGNLEGADLIYLTGGNPAHLLESILGSAAAEVIKEVAYGGGVVIGSSAGAMVLGEVMRGGNTGSWVPGLGLVQHIAVRPHQDQNSENDYLALRKGLGTPVSLLGIPTATACVSDGNGLQVLGTRAVTVYSSQGISKYSPSERFMLE